jgi:hypothetical protein
VQEGKILQQKLPERKLERSQEKLSLSSFRGIRKFLGHFKVGVNKVPPPLANLKTLVNKNAGKTRNKGTPPGNLMTPPRDFDKIFKYPLPWIFNPCASMSVW